VLKNHARFPNIAHVAALTLAIVYPASAYVEPGSGALLWQMMIAGLVGGVFYVRRISRWITERLQGSRKPAPR
jgi:membrane associated rhomboid family serine protease